MWSQPFSTRTSPCTPIESRWSSSRAASEATVMTASSHVRGRFHGTAVPGRYGIDAGMAENWKDRLGGDREASRKNVQDWMNGQGGRILAACLIALVVFGIVKIFQG